MIYIPPTHCLIIKQGVINACNNQAISIGKNIHLARSMGKHHSGHSPTDTEVVIE